MLAKAFYEAELSDFLQASSNSIVGALAARQTVEPLQERAWREQISILQNALQLAATGHILFEMQIPRMGRRADVVLILADFIFVIEFKVGATHHAPKDLRQCHGYAIDLHHFHEGSHTKTIVPILVATDADSKQERIKFDGLVVAPVCATSANLAYVISDCTHAAVLRESIDFQTWYQSSYRPTPTIIEAAQALYGDHRVEDIARSDAGAKNLLITSNEITSIIRDAQARQRKVICFVTGVPGAGKTLVGLNLATLPEFSDKAQEKHAVFLSGNGPLVAVLVEALARDSVARNSTVSKAAAYRDVGAKIQNIHWFRDEAIKDPRAPHEHVVIFDEAQRAWDKTQAVRFMKQKRGLENFTQSEPDFLIGVMDRHNDWCVIVALIGGGQEINTGEAGLQGWVEAVAEKYRHWDVHYSEKLAQLEYSGSDVSFNEVPQARKSTALHLATSMRSFRAEYLSHMVHYMIHNRPVDASALYKTLRGKFPVMVTRDLADAKDWIRAQARANETKGLVASSGGLRLKPTGIHVKNRIEAADWFLNDCEDVRSCHYLEDVATEFDIQGLELDWSLVAWDADYRYRSGSFEHWRFTGTTWKRRVQFDQQRFLENAYRVLLTRARQGMIIFLPRGDRLDRTRDPQFFDETYNYLLSCGVEPLPLANLNVRAEKATIR